MMADWRFEDCRNAGYRSLYLLEWVRADYFEAWAYSSWCYPS